MDRGDRGGQTSGLFSFYSKPLWQRERSTKTNGLPLFEMPVEPGQRRLLDVGVIAMRFGRIVERVLLGTTGPGVSQTGLPDRLLPRRGL